MRRIFLIATVLSMSLTSNSQILEGADSLNKLKVGIDFKPTKYKAGYVFYEQHGAKVTLLRWVGQSQMYGVVTHRWSCRIEIKGVSGSAMCWFDDESIEKYSKLYKPK